MSGATVDTKIIFDYNKADYDGMREVLRYTDWPIILQGDTDHCWNVFKEKILNLKKNFVPMRKVKGNGIKKPI